MLNLISLFVGKKEENKKPVICVACREKYPEEIWISDEQRETSTAIGYVCPGCFSEAYNHPENMRRYIVNE